MNYRLTVLDNVAEFDAADVTPTNKGAWFQFAGHEVRAWFPDSMYVVILTDEESIACRAGRINKKIDDGTVTDDDLAELSGLALELRDRLRGQR